MLIFLESYYCTYVFAQRPADNFERRVHYFANDSVQYRLFIPNDSATSNLYPLILTSHGAGEIGNDNNIHITKWRIAEAWAEDSVQLKYPSFICSPQFPPRPNLESYLQNIWNPSIKSMLDSLINEFPIDTNRIYLTGLSFGAFGTWDFIYKSLPYRFAAAIPMSGSWPWDDEIPIITDIPVWVFCGVYDELVTGVRETISYIKSAGYQVEKRYTKYGTVYGSDPGDVGLTIDEINLLNQANIKHIYTEFTDGEHLVWSKTYDDPALHYWLFSQRRDTNGRKISAQVLSWEVSPKYIPLKGDTIKIISEILNPESSRFDVHAYVEGVQSDFTDSLQLFDDGLHGDLAPSDNVYANYILPPNLEEDFFNILIRATDFGETRKLYSPDKGYFTTAGPVVLDSFSVLVSQDTIVGLMDMHLKNLSNTIIMNDVTAKLETSDTNVVSIPRAELSFSDILPNESKKRDSGWMYFYTKNNPSEIKFLLEISSNNHPYWYDTLVVKINPTNIKNTKTNILVTFELKQNYPNPFNPSTVISYAIPTSVKSETMPTGRQEANVKLVIYDILGREIATLVNEKQKPGNYEVEFNSNSGNDRNLTSGIYFYRLQVYTPGRAGDFVETKKMVLVK